MQLGDLFANLSYGSLSNLAIGGEGSGVIPAQHEPRLVSLTNQALKLLSGKFLMCEKEVIIRAIEGRAIYPLEYEFAESNTAATGDKFIVDTVEQPFMEDVVTVLEIYDELNQDQRRLGPLVPLHPVDHHSTDTVPEQRRFLLRPLPSPAPQAGDW